MKRHLTMEGINLLLENPNGDNDELYTIIYFIYQFFLLTLIQYKQLHNYNKRFNNRLLRDHLEKSIEYKTARIDNAR